MNSRNSKGFTIIEAMIVIALLAILATMGYPSYKKTMEKSRASAASSEILKALTYARTEAISRNRFIGVCPKESPDAQECGDAEDWHNGFLVFVDKDNDKDFDPDDDILLQEYYLKQPVNVNISNITKFIWHAGGLKLSAWEGNRISTPNGTIRIIPAESPSGFKGLYRECAIAGSGRISCDWSKKE